MQPGRLLRIFFFCIFSSLSAAHFLLNYPTSIGFDDANEAIGPCGGTILNLATENNITFFRVGGDTIAITNTHPTTTFLFRAALGQNAGNSTKWTLLEPPMQQVGLGSWCIQQFPVPSTFAGSDGIIQIISDAPDGILYQVSELLITSIKPLKLQAKTLTKLSLVCCGEFPPWRRPVQ